MSSSLAGQARALSVFIVAGPSVAALLQSITSTATKRRIGLLTSETSESEAAHFVVEQLAHDPAEITNQIRIIADTNTLDHLIIKCTAEMPAIALASLFLPRDDAPRRLTESAKLITTVLTINPSVLVDSLIGVRQTEGLISPCFVAEQIEFAGHIFLDGNPDSPGFERARAIANALNPRARVLELSGESLKEVLDHTGTSFDFAAALDGAGWRQLIDAEEPRGPDDGCVLAFAYRARKPFHPQRFWDVLQSGFAGVFRAKGFFWLATRNDQVGGVNLAGSEFQVAPAGKWWAARDEHAREAEMPDRTRKEWKGPFGDRRQAIAFMGIDCDPHRLNAQLDACLLTDLEMAGGEQSWRTLHDPFPSWAGEAHHHDCDHEDDGDEHDCCHH
jgi:G3E family GTPase